MIHLYSGDGKGKTSIAVGMAVRMAGAGGKVIFAQFMKGNESSELSVLRDVENIKVVKMQEEFAFYPKLTDEEKMRMTKFHNRILQQIKEEVDKVVQSSVDLLVVLDEITYPCNWKLVDVDLLKCLLEELPENVELVLTGREPMDFMVEYADYWSEVQRKRHPYEKNIPARYGIEY